MNKLDVWIDVQFSREFKEAVVMALWKNGAAIYGSGLSLNYLNIFGSTPQDFSFPELLKTPGVYVNAYPPEIQAELDLESREVEA